MLDVLGYWFAVSVIVVVSAFPALLLMRKILASFINKVYEEGCKGDGVMNKYLEFEYSEWRFFRGWRIKEGVGILITALGVIFLMLFIIVSIGLITPNGEIVTKTPIELIHAISAFIAPVSAYTAVPLVLYYGGIFLARKALAVKTKLDTINEKLKEVE